MNPAKLLLLTSPALEKLLGASSCPCKCLSSANNGRLPSTDGTVHVSYSYAHRTDLKEPSDYFYTRQLSYPILVTVYPMLQCQNMDLLAFPSYHDYVGTGEGATRRFHLDIDDGTSWCLFSVDVRNMYGSPFEVTFEREQSGMRLLFSEH